MALRALHEVRHNGKKYQRGDAFPAQGQEATKEQVNRLKELGAIADEKEVGERAFVPEGDPKASPKAK